MADLSNKERGLLQWLGFDDGTYGECHGETLDSLIAKGLAQLDPDNTHAYDPMYRKVQITEAGVTALQETTT
jgi:hypothetical protein